MARRKIKITRIENPTTRQVTFSKRRGGLLKKVHDLAVLCDAEVAVVIFSSKGKLFQFASPSMGRVLEHYKKSCEDSKAPTNNNSSDNVGIGSLPQSSQKLSASHSNLTYGDLERHSLPDLIHLEQQVLASLEGILRKKEELLQTQLEDARQKMTEAQRTNSANSNVLKKLLDIGSSDITGSQRLGGQGGSQHHCLQELLQTGSSFPLRAKTRELACGMTRELTCTTSKRPVIREDLNTLPAFMED